MCLYTGSLDTGRDRALQSSWAVWWEVGLAEGAAPCIDPQPQMGGALTPGALVSLSRRLQTHHLWS